MKCFEISEANKKLVDLKRKFRYYQLSTEDIKCRIYDPYDCRDKNDWEMSNQQEIWEISIF